LSALLQPAGVRAWPGSDTHRPQTKIWSPTMITTATPGQARRSIRPLMGLIQRLQNLWYLRPVRTQILIAFLVITLIASIIAGLVKLLDASNRASTEMRAAVGLAESFAQETTRALQSAEDV